MLSIQIKDLKKFTALLFTEDAFDKFLLHDALFETAFTTEIDGARNKAYFEDEEQDESMKNVCVSWAAVRPAAFKLISGKKLPVSFRVILMTDKKSTEVMKTRTGFTDCEVTSLSINISYKENTLQLTTGAAYNGFSLDKSLEKYWDDAVSRFLTQKECEFE